MSVPEAAERLRTRIETDWRHYGEIAVIAHSQGCLVTRRFIADQLKARHVQPIGRMLFIAGPHMGAMLGTAARAMAWLAKGDREAARALLVESSGGGAEALAELVGLLDVTGHPWLEGL